MVVRVTGLLFLLCLILPKFTVRSENKNYSAEKPLWTRLKPKVVKGEPATLGEIPYQVAFKTLKYSRKHYLTFCGGSILKEKVVLSAAHCFVPSQVSFFKYCTGRLDTKHYRTTHVVAGNLKNQVKYSERRAAGQWRRIASIAYPYSHSFPIDDIAVVHLTTPYTFDNNVAAIPYARKYNNYLGLQCLASGYGMTGPKSMAENLQKAYLEIMPNELCNSLFANRMTKFVCTVDRVTNVLQGDSGGPLVCQKTGDPAEETKGVLVGIVSGGAQRRGTIFTRVSSFAKYIARGKADLNRTIFNSQYLLLLIWILL